MPVAQTPEFQSKRIRSIDLLRIISCFLVIVTHTNSRIFIELTPSATWFISLGYFFVSKIAVPIFVIITGYTLLPRQDTYKESLMRFLRFGFVLLLFSGLYYLWDLLSGASTMNINGFLGGIVNAPITTAFWYMYLYLALLLMMPFLQKLVTVLARKDFHAFFILSALFYSVRPIVVYYIPQLRVSEHFSLPLFNSYIALLLLGFYFRKFCTPSKKWRIPCIIIFFASCLLCVLLTYIEHVKSGGEKYLFLDSATLLPIIAGAVSLFAFVSTMDIKGAVGEAITSVGKLTFGIYLLSDLAIDKLEFVYLNMVGNGLHALPAVLVYQILVFAVCLAVSFLLRKIPGLRRLL